MNEDLEKLSIQDEIDVFRQDALTGYRKVFFVVHGLAMLCFGIGLFLMSPGEYLHHVRLQFTGITARGTIKEIHIDPSYPLTDNRVRVQVRYEEDDTFGWVLKS